LRRRARYRFLPFPLFQVRPKRNGGRRTTRLAPLHCAHAIR